MKQIFNIVLIVVAVGNLADAFTKYGRTCKDIGCTSNQVCVMKEDPCTQHSKRNSCGKYPTCVKVSNNAASCASYVCPPTMSCRMDRGVPKCFASNVNSKSRAQINNPQNPGSYSNYNNQLGYGQTTSRPNIYQTGQRVNGGGGGYHGGAIGSGYPGGQGGYPQYPVQGYGQATARPNIYQIGTRFNGGSYQNYGQTTSRPNVYQTGQRISGGGYHGGSVGSGYPGQNGYPRQNGGYYPQQTYQYNGYSNHGQYNTAQEQPAPLDSISKFLKTNFNINW